MSGRRNQFVDTFNRIAINFPMNVALLFFSFFSSTLGNEANFSMFVFFLSSLCMNVVYAFERVKINPKNFFANFLSEI
jgi:hypothetical protein